MSRVIASSAVLEVVSPSPGFERAISLNAGTVGGDISPFFDLSEFVMSQPTFRPHPHAGFSAVTYMFPDSAGSFRNRWSKGDPVLIEPGSLHWTQAGVGMVHEEIPTEPGVPCHGLQMFVKLAAADEVSPPLAFHLSSDDVVEVQPAPGVLVRVLAGQAFGADAGIGILNDLTLLDVHLDAGSTLDIDAVSEDNAFVFVRCGSVVSSGTQLNERSAAVYRHDADVVSLAAVTDASVLVGTGRPLDEPAIASGPFIMSSRVRLAEASAAFKRGDMGHLGPSF